MRIGPSSLFTSQCLKSLMMKARTLVRITGKPLCLQSPWPVSRETQGHKEANSTTVVAGVPQHCPTLQASAIFKAHLPLGKALLIILYQVEPNDAIDGWGGSKQDAIICLSWQMYLCGLHSWQTNPREPEPSTIEFHQGTRLSCVLVLRYVSLKSWLWQVCWTLTQYIYSQKR